MCLDIAVGVEDVSLSLLHLQRELLPKESNPVILDRFDSSSLHISLHNSECSSLRTIQSHAISFPKSSSVVAPGMTWGPPSEFTLSCLVFSSSLVFSSVCLFFPRHLVCAHRPRRGARCHRPEDSGVDIAAARIVILFFHSHFSLFSRESFVRCARKKKFSFHYPFSFSGWRLPAAGSSPIRWPFLDVLHTKTDSPFCNNSSAAST